MIAPTLRNPYEPRLGLFWFLGKYRNPARFAALTRSFNRTDQNEGVHKLETTHTDAWPQLQLLDSSLSAYAFDFFPRGHVEFSPAQERWLLFLDQKLLRGAFVAHVVIKWNIPPDRLATKCCRDYRSIARIGPPM